MAQEQARPAPAGGAEPMQLPLSYMMWGQSICQSVYIVAKLGIVDELQDGPKTAAELAAAVGADPVNLGRLLRAMTTFALFIEDADGRFQPTPRGELLGSTHPQSQRAMALLMAEPFVWSAYGQMIESVRTGRPAFESVHGQSFFDYLGSHADDNAIFNAAMTGGTIATADAVADAYDWSPYRKIVDVGGGQGALLRAILERNRDASGVLADLPRVIAGADLLRDSEVADRCEFVGIDMFKAVPAGGDLYILKQILHDWNDEQALQILRNCRAATDAGGRVLHIGAVLGPSNQADPSKWVDLTMMTMLPGRERTETEFRDMYAEAGFQLTRTYWVSGSFGLVEGVAV